MPPNTEISPFKLTTRQKKLIISFLTGKARLKDTTEALGVTKMRLYTMCTALIRHASTTKVINIEEVIKHY